MKKARMSKKMTLSIASFVVSVFLSMSFAPVLAQTTVLPSSGATDCAEYIKTNKKAYESRKDLVALLGGAKENRSAALSTYLGCGVKTGKIRLFMMPFFVTYIIQFLIVMAGLIAVLFVAIGGFRYVVGGITEDKESGKKTVTHALVGLVVSLAAWIIVNFVQLALTS